MNVVYCNNVKPSTTKEGKIYSDICRHFPTTSIRGNKYIHFMYVYDCNAILTTAMKNRSDKDMIKVFISLTEDLKIKRINPGFHLMDNEASTSLNLTMTTMKIKYELVPQSNHRENSAEREIQTFKNHFIAGLCIVEIFSYSIMVQTFKAGKNQSKPAQTIKNPSPHISLHSHLQII